MITFLVTAGVFQGGPESPVLFNLFIDFVMRIFVCKAVEDNSIHFFQHKYCFNPRTVTREQYLSMHNEGMKLGTVSSPLVWIHWRPHSVLTRPSFITERNTLINNVFTKYQAWAGRNTPACDHRTPRFQMQYFRRAVVAVIRVNEIFPTDWNIGLLTILPKKGDLRKPGNYRGIMLLESSYKVIFSRPIPNEIGWFTLHFFHFLGI